jgi:ATP-dependent protease ClpP protease subunit
MAVYNIPIYGLIGSPEDETDTATYFQYSDLLTHLNKATLYDTLNLDIASNGGFVDVCDKMIDRIKATGKFITSCNSGNVASAASKLFTLAPKGSRFFHADKGVFLIHNPWGEVEGDSTILSDAAKSLKGIENEYAAWYAAATGSDETILKDFMAENKPLTTAQVEELGFATIVQPVIKAVAKLTSNNNKMELKQVEEKMNGFEKSLKRVMAFFKIKAIMLADANGKELEFPDLTDASEITVGVKVMEAGAPANGEYPQPDGSVLKCENGVLIEIVPPAGGDDMEALKAENTALKTELESLKAAKVTAEMQATEAGQTALEIKAEFVKFKSQFSDYKFKGATPDDDSDPKKKIIISKDQLEKM